MLVNRTSNILRTRFYIIIISRQKNTSTQPTAYPGIRTLIRRALELRKAPESSLDIMVASLSETSLKQYNTGLKSWWKFCQSNHQSVFSASPEVVLSFLSEKFREGASYGSLNTSRSAIALLVGPHIGQDDVIKRFFKGIFRLRPTKPKYTCSWDPSIVLDYWTDRHPTRSLDLQDLTHKLVSLLALTTAHRVQTFAAIDIRNITCSSEGVVINIPQLLKTSVPTRPQPTLYLPFFTDNPNICPASTLTEYLERTHTLRQEGEFKLLITFKKPHHAASTQSISRWIKSTLKNSGLDTTIFSAHSTRHASTSLAARKQVSIDLIRTQAGWSNRSKVFATYYNRPLDNKGVFAKTVLSSNNKA